MLRYLAAFASLALCTASACAAEAGKVIFVAGQASLDSRHAVEGASVNEGDLLDTGADGFIYVKTIDDGLFILRPNTKARIVAYHIDVGNPANTRIKLELISGVARSKSGKAVKQARQNFRFNTPVAAIGVRGTDFTVFTDQNVSRVAVISGGVVVSGFAGSCNPEGIGPCEGSASRELSATQRGQMLQVQRGKGVPQLMEGGALAPDEVPYPKQALEQGGRASPAPVVNLDPKKGDSLTQPAAPSTPPTRPPVSVVPPPIENVELPAQPVLPPRDIVWGRWQAVLDKPSTLSFEQEKAVNELIATRGYFALFRTPGKAYEVTERGSVGFALKDSEAYIADGTTGRVIGAATLSNGKLMVDFGARTFTTSLDMKSGTEALSLQGQGVLALDGRLYGDAAYGRRGFINVDGVLSNANGGTASYIFDGRLDPTRTFSGATYWQRPVE